MTSSSSDKFNTIWLVVILAGATFVFGSLLGAEPLTWDDDAQIFNNPHFMAGEWLTFWRGAYLGLYVPVVDSVWQLLFTVGKGGAGIFRVFNLLLHLANTLLVYLLLRGLGRRWTLPPFAILVGVAIFALHPLQVQAVAWISGGRDLLASVLALSCLFVYYRRTEVAHAQFALATALYLAAMLCKPSVAILPLVALGLDLIFKGQITPVSGLRIALWSFFAGAVAWLTVLAQGASSSVTLGERLTVVLDTYSFYLQKFVAPFDLTANYGRTPAVVLAEGTRNVAVLMVVLVLTGFALLAWRRDRRYALILLWFLALLPVSGVISFGAQQISTVSDHYQYLPMALLAAFVAFVISRIAWPSLAYRALLALLVGGLGSLSYARTKAWKNDLSFFTDMSQHSPESYATAVGMSIVMCEDVKNYEEGIKWTEAALKAKPNDILALSNQAYCFLHAGNYFRVIELEYYLGQLNIDDLEKTQPTAYASLLSSIGSAYIEQQEYEDGFQFLCEAYRVLPSEPSHLENLKIAKDILQSKGIEPTCEQVHPTEDEPIQEVWPQLGPEEE